METVYPASSSALSRGRRVRRGDLRARRTTPVTFAEIKEVDEDNEEALDVAGATSNTCEERRRRRPDLLDEPLGRQFVEFRQRRARRRRDELRERDPEEPPAPRAASEPRPLAPRASTPGDDTSLCVEREHDIT